MANPHKGEVAFESLGEKYKLSFSANAMAEMEAAFGVDFNELSPMLTDEKKFSVRRLRILFHIGLGDCHPEIDETTAKKIFAGLLLQDAIDLVSKTLEMGVPQSKGSAADPQKPAPDQASTGPA